MNNGGVIMPFMLCNYPENTYSEQIYTKPLYHYTSIKTLQDITKNKSIRFRKNNYSNDENDGKIIEKVRSIIPIIESEQSLIGNSYWECFKGLALSKMDELEKLTLEKTIPFQKIPYD